MIKFGSLNVKDIRIGEQQVKKVAVGSEVIWEKSGGGLPSGYTQVKYLESSGTQYINTGIKQNSTTDFEIKLNYSSGKIGSDGWCGAFGVFTAATYPMYALRTHAIYGYIQFMTRFNSSIAYGSSVRHLDEDVVAKKVGEDVYYNDENYGTLSYTANLNKDIYLFNMNTNEAPYSSALSSLRIYYLKLLEAGILVQNLIPCLDTNNTPCMYDTVTQQTFYNQGTGEFGYETMDGTIVAPT